MIIVEEVAIEETCRQMSIKLVDSCYVILPDHLVLHPVRQCISLEFLNIYMDNFGKLLLPVSPNYNVQPHYTLRIYFQNLCKKQSLNNSSSSQ